MSDKPEGSGAPPLATRTEAMRLLSLVMRKWTEAATAIDESWLRVSIMEAAQPPPNVAVTCPHCGTEFVTASEQPRAAPLEPLADLPEKEK